MKDSGPSLFWAEMTKSLHKDTKDGKCRRITKLYRSQQEKAQSSYLLLDSRQNLNVEDCIAHTDLTEVHCFFLDDLSLTVLVSAIRSESLLVAITRVTAFLKERLGAIGSAIFLNDKVRRTAHVRIAVGVIAVQRSLLFF